MNKEKMKFWLSCPYCKKKFGISPELVFKYVDRLLESMERGLKENVGRFKAGTVSPPDHPVAEE